MNIVFVSQNASPGFCIFRKDLIKCLVSKGHTVYAFALDYTEESKNIVASMGAIPMDYSLSKTGLNPFRDLKDTWVLFKKLKSLEAAVVFSFFIKPSLYGTLAAKFAGVQHRIAMLEGLGYLYTPVKKGVSLKKIVLQLVHGLLCSVCYAFANEVLFLNPDDPKDLSKRALLFKNKCKVIGPIGLDLTAYPYSKIVENKTVRFIFIARLLAEKGIFEYLAAARLIKSKCPHAEFVVLGGLDPDNPSALSKAQLDNVVAENLVIYPGHVSDVAEWIKNSHVFVLPSYYREGVPRSTQEAMAIGRAVITTDVPGCRETVINGSNGFLIPPFDAQALAKKMEYFIEYSEEIKRMGHQSHLIAKDRFDVNNVNKVLCEILLKL